MVREVKKIITYIGPSYSIVTIYYFIKIDWEKIIGKWFPWTLEKDKSSDSKDERENMIVPSPTPLPHQ